MADERCVFPGDAESPRGSAGGRGPGRRPGHWLDRRTAERLLSGETPDNAVDSSHRDEAERLTRTLGALAALSAEPAPADEELPGEAAALAAFRKARAERAVEPTASADLSETRFGDTAAPSAFPLAPAERDEPGDRTAVAATSAGPGTARSADAGLVRIGGGRGTAAGRPRRHRPARLALAAALAVGITGGVAVAAGTGVLPTPFDNAEPGPAASVSAAATPGPDRPLASPPTGTTPGGGGAGKATPGGESGTPAPNTEGSAKGADDPAARDSGGRPSGVTSACRDVLDGKTLETERRRTLEGAAGGRSRVPSYCTRLLGSSTGQGSDGGSGQGGTDAQDGNGGKDGKGDDGGKGDEGGKGGGKGEGGDKGGRGGNTGKGGDSGDKGAVSGGGTGRGDSASTTSGRSVHRSSGVVGAPLSPSADPR
ncbi:hypothetical protein ACIHAR_16460 [Streptomyces sp. NPDC052016]|uniref:hypothetical protein n=1 Tax=Streptomyces sp. NPDC052016 TaxID=3365680 RepID=UPI0037D6551E